MPDLPLINAFAPTRLPESAEALREDVKAFLKDRLREYPAHQRAKTWSGFDPDFSRDLASRGWIGLTLPKEYGGGGADAFSRFVLVEELLAAGAPVAAHWIGDRQSGPLLMQFGTEEQRRFYLPGICAGKTVFCIGMSEPNSGSDLASIRTRAVADGDGWRLSGSKIWTTFGHRSDYMIAIVRTSGTSEDRQAGLSQFIIDMTSPGISVKPIVDMCGDAHFSEIFFDDVRLPADALVGSEGQGWHQVNAELAFERSGPERIYSSLVLLDLWAAHLRTTHTGALHEQRLGKLIARLAILREMSIALTAKLACNESPVVEAALLKDLGTELEQAIPAEIADALATDPLPVDPELMRTLAYLLQINSTFSLRGGTREILRSMIARGLGLR
jgi:alkylation response protein AidB-like acyl-CoA dehydrogenase